MSSVAQLLPLDAATAAVILGWVGSAEDLALIAGPTLSWPLTTDQLLDTIDDAQRVARVLVADGVPVGFGTLRRHDDSVRLGWILVDPARRGEGWGRELLVRLMAESHRLYGPRRLTLGVFTHNQPAIQLYRSLGFQEGPPVPIDFADYPWHKTEMERALSDQP